MFLRGLEGWHIVIIIGLIALLFGAKRMPDAARSVGQSLRIFKAEVKAANVPDENETTRAATPVAPMIANSEVSRAAPDETARPAPASHAGTPAQ